ncbi:MAG: GNAT family N-acetyltransferase [Chloroflexota bacterium]
MPPDLIRGARTILRPVTPGDLDLLHGWLNDPEVYRYWGGFPHSREQVEEQYTGQRAPDVAGFIVEADGVPIGYLQYWLADEKSGGLDMYLIPSKRGQRLGPDAARAAVRYVMDELGWQRVTVDPAADNHGGIRGWERAGFVYEQDWPDHPDGPAVLMAIERSTHAPEDRADREEP